MSREEAQRLLATRQGQVKAWVLRWDTYQGIAAELGIGIPGDEPDFRGAYRLWNFPVVFVEDDQPEGVVV